MRSAALLGHHRLPLDGEPAPLVLAAHGSRDPASAASMRALADRVGRVWPAPVVAAFLDFDRPSIPDALDALADLPVHRPPVVVPALLTNAYHRRVDLPSVLAAVAVPTVLADVLGPDPWLVAALRRRLSELAQRSGRPLAADGIALLAAGTSDLMARSTVDGMAAELGRQLGVMCVTGYASADGPTGREAVVALRAAGARRVVAASYFLAPGLLYSAVSRSARDAGVVGVAAPLGTAAEVVRLVVARARAALDTPVGGSSRSAG